MGGFQPFQWFLHLKQTMIQIIQSTLGKIENPRLYALLCLTDLMQLGLKWSGMNHTAQLIYPIRNGKVLYLAVSTHTSGPAHLKMEGGRVLAVKVFAISESLFCLLLSTGSDLV